MINFSVNVIDHNIQRDILRYLTVNGGSRFSQIKPSGLESNLFMYHMTKLIKSGLVEKADGLYSLSSGGRVFIDKVNLENMKLRIQPKINTLLVVNYKDEYLLMKRMHEPDAGSVGFITGKVHFGEDIYEAANRELEEKAGILVENTRLIGNYISRYVDDNGEVVAHNTAYVFTASVDQRLSLNSSRDYWVPYWGESSELKSGKAVTSHHDILSLVKAESLFIESNDFKSKY